MSTTNLPAPAHHRDPNPPEVPPQPKHECGMCGGLLVYCCTNDVDIVGWRCVQCGEEHTSEDCCEDLTGRRYLEHNNDFGDWCPWSGRPAPEFSYSDERCPAGCMRSGTEEACTTCGGALGGDGWNGECGDCADRTENVRNRVDMTALQQAVAAAGHVALVANTSGNTVALFAGRLVAGDDEREVRWSVSAGSGWFEPSGEAVADRYEFGYGHDSKDENASWVALDDGSDLDGLAGAIVKMIEEVERHRAAEGVPSASRDLIVQAYGEGVADAQARVYAKPAALPGGQA